MYCLFLLHFQRFSCMGSFLLPWVCSHFSPFSHSIRSQKKKWNIYYEYFNVIFYFLAATLFMSHVRNAHSKRSNFLSSVIQTHMDDVFSFNLVILIHFLHELISKSANAHIYFYTTKRNKCANRKQIKMSKKTEINFVKLSRFNRASPLSDRNQWFMMRSRGLTIDSQCLSDQWNWLLASQKKNRNNKNNENPNETHAQFCWA